MALHSQAKPVTQLDCRNEASLCRHVCVSESSSPTSETISTEPDVLPHLSEDYRRQRRTRNTITPCGNKGNISLCQYVYIFLCYQGNFDRGLYNLIMLIRKRHRNIKNKITMYIYICICTACICLLSSMSTILSTLFKLNFFLLATVYIYIYIYIYVLARYAKGSAFKS